MFLQQYIAYWQYDLSANTTTLSLQKSASNTLTNSFIGNATLVTQTASPFTALYGTLQTLYVNSDQFTMQTTIGGNLGYQGQKQFGVNPLANYVQTFSDNCIIKLPGVQQKSCNNAPIYGDLYWNATNYNTTVQAPLSGLFDGYNSSGLLYNSSVCLKTQTTDLFCTQQNTEFYVADSVYSNDWNYGNRAQGGSFGLGPNSPVWQILGNPQPKYFDVYLSNFNNWQTVNSSYAPNTTDSEINLNGFSSDYDNETDSFTEFKPTIQGG